MRAFLRLAAIFGVASLLSASAVLRDTHGFAEQGFRLVAKRIVPRGMVAAKELRRIAAWRLTSSNANFGGISALVRHQGGFLALSDAGVWIRFRMDARGVRDARIATLPGACGLRTARPTRDSESIALDPGGNAAWIGFEYNNRICRTDAAMKAARAVARPKAMRRWPKIGGAETMARLADGRFLVIAERPRGGGRVSPALMFASDPTGPAARPIGFRYRPAEGYRPTDAAELPDGKLLILERAHRWPFSFPGRLAILSPEAIAPGATVDARTILRLGGPHLDQNFEAVAVSQSGGRTFVWLMSDDNFMPVQQTLLLLFEYRG